MTCNVREIRCTVASSGEAPDSLAVATQEAYVKPCKHPVVEAYQHIYVWKIMTVPIK